MNGADGQHRGSSENAPLTQRKFHDRALLLPIVGALLLLPPLAGIFQLDMRIAGVPVTAVYLFGVWAILIIAAYALSRALQNAEHTTAVETDASRESSPEDDPH